MNKIGNAELDGAIQIANEITKLRARIAELEQALKQAPKCANCSKNQK